MNVKNRNRGLLLLLALTWACGTKQEGKEKAMEEQTMEEQTDKGHLLKARLENAIGSAPLGPKTRFVLLPEGLPLYENENTLMVLSRLPLGSRLEVLEATGQKREEAPYRGEVLKVAHEGREGYVFSAYLSAYPPPSFADEREYILKGDVKTYTEELKGHGLKARCENPGCDWIFFPGANVQEVYLIARLLLPSLMSRIPLIRYSIEIDHDAEEREADMYIDLPKGRGEGWDRTLEVYIDNSVVKEGEILYWSNWFRGGGKVLLALNPWKMGQDLSMGKMTHRPSPK